MVFNNNLFITIHKCISFTLKRVYDFFNNTPPRPYSFVQLELRSSLVEFTEIMAQIELILPQFSEFINQFNNLVQNTNINVITEVDGTLSIDVPSSMPDTEVENISKRISIIDRLITTKDKELTELLEKGSSLDSQLKLQNPNHNSVILNKVKEFERLKLSYKH
jgi:hypothetical protein